MFIFYLATSINTTFEPGNGGYIELDLAAPSASSPLCWAVLDMSLVGRVAIYLALPSQVKPALGDLLIASMLWLIWARRLYTSWMM